MKPLYGNIDEVQRTKEMQALLGHQKDDIERLEDSRDYWRKQEGDLQKTAQRLLAALEKIIVHGVWDECIYCNAKVKIAELATDQPVQSQSDD